MLYCRWSRVCLRVTGSGREVVGVLLDSRSGCKVGWNVWSTREEAEADSPKQREDAYRKAARGYDFGYCMPGEIREYALQKEQTFRLAEVTLEAGTVVYKVTTP